LRGTADQSAAVGQRLNRELLTWRHLNHRNVVELLGIAYLESNLPPGLVSQWVLRHDFLAYVGRHPDRKLEMAQHVTRGVQYLHDNAVVHGDLKVNNVIVSDHHEAQVTDFGIAYLLDVKGYTSSIRTRNVRYTAPELMPTEFNEENPEEVRPTKQSDIFSLGILLLQLFHGPDPDPQRGLPYNHIPYNPVDYDYPLLQYIHANHRPRRQNYNMMSDRHWFLMEWCWAAEASRRPVIADVLRGL